MAMKKLPSVIQSLICASSQINSFKRAIEELVYNSLDANSTSIAIRVHINENKIQVIDNGDGVVRHDFSLLGQRYATSKCVDLATLKSAPNKYGFRGESLASIIDISHSVNITSRSTNAEETWLKSFCKGKEQELSITSQRPSKGTTVEVKGFLYNLSIQKKAIDYLNELQDIKNFLEQLSLVHNNISVSLRDDSKNEIVFSLHKNRDVYQTLSSLFDVQKTDVKELKVEKNQYKVTALIGDKDSEINQHHWIYLNGKFMHNSKLHKIINDNLTKYLRLKVQNKRKSKLKKINDDDTGLAEKNIPFYFIFLTCPYYDYDLNYITKQTVIDFKNWDPVNKLLEKLVKFYTGDIALKEITKADKNHVKNQENGDERNKVKQIIEKILGNNTKKPGVSQMQNGVKGKLTKRKAKKKSQKISLSKVIPTKNNNDYNVNYHTEHSKLPEKHNLHPECSVAIASPKVKKVCKKMKISNTTKKLDNVKKPKASNYKQVEKTIGKNRNEINLNVLIDKEPQKLKQKKETRRVPKKLEKCIVTANKIKQNTSNGKSNTLKKRNDLNKIKRNQKLDILVQKFEKESGSVKRRCNLLAKKVDELMSYKKKRKCKVFVNENVQYSSIIRNNKNVSIRKTFDEIVVHHYKHVQPQSSESKSIGINDLDGNELKRKPCKSSYDLLQTILKTQQKYDTVDEELISPLRDTSNITPPYEIQYIPDRVEPEQSTIEPILTKLTFDSHNYAENQYFVDSHLAIPINNRIPNHIRIFNNSHFITKQSRDNFVVLQDIQNRRKVKAKNRKPFSFKTKTPYERKTSDKNRDMFETSYTIEFSRNTENHIQCDEHYDNPTPDRPSFIEMNIGRIREQISTYTMEIENDGILNSSPKVDSTYTVISNSLRIYSNNYKNREDFRENLFASQRSHSLQELNGNLANIGTVPEICANDEYLRKGNKRKIVFVSKSQNTRSTNDNVCDNVSIEAEFHPLNLCETELHTSSYEVIENDVEPCEQGHNDFNDEFSIESLLCDRNGYHSSLPLLGSRCSLEKISHHFRDETNNNLNLEHRVTGNEDQASKGLEENARTITNPGDQNDENVIFEEHGQSLHNDDIQINEVDINKFNLKTRPSFVPKGLSPIFENCQTKNNCDYVFEKDYYEDVIYNNFANDVQTNTEVFEPRIQNVNEHATKDIEKFNIKLCKDNASLLFNSESLKYAKILGQADEKFIAAKIKGKIHNSVQMAEFLVLFDQHAVHERVRLEKNLSDYINEDQWISSTLDDEILLRLSNDEILCLHNYKDKFAQFGLQWTILNNYEVNISAIPEAILGKNPRQVEVIMKAVKNLITEEINAIKYQKGCISLYPKAIMDLIFSEACRYAIKFGDRLSINDCVELLKSLSDCKTPFQCAHGRPVMAVIMDLKDHKYEYKMDKSKIQSFIKRSNQL